MVHVLSNCIIPKDVVAATICPTLSFLTVYSSLVNSYQMGMNFKPCRGGSTGGLGLTGSNKYAHELNYITFYIIIIIIIDGFTVHN